MKTVLIIGATSGIGHALGQEFAARGMKLILAARNTERLKFIKEEIESSSKLEIITVSFDALDFDSHLTFYNNLQIKPDIVICTFGYLGDQQKAANDWDESSRIIDTNYKGSVSILSIIANDFEMRRSGIIVGVSSVAGERGRQSNYVYGSTKAAFTKYLDGLRNRLYPSGVHVITVKPGFVNTPMIEGLTPPKVLVAEPAVVARKIYRACSRKQNVIYVLPVWRWIMLMIRNIPESIFKRLKF